MTAHGNPWGLLTTGHTLGMMAVWWVWAVSASSRKRMGGMITASELRQTARARLADAEALLKARRYDAAVYICGYAVEIALKARICKSLHWREYPVGRGFESFKTHDLDVLLHLSGREAAVKAKALPQWSTVKNWKPESRYGPIGKITRQDARDMIGSTRDLIGVLG